MNKLGEKRLSYKEMCLLIKSVFTTADGEKLLKIWIDDYSVFIPGTINLISDIYKNIYKNAQRDVILEILNNIDFITSEKLLKNN